MSSRRSPVGLAAAAPAVAVAALALAAAACTGGPAATPPPPSAVTRNPTAAAEGRRGAGTAAGSADSPATIRAVPASPTRGISVTTNMVSFPDGTDARPGSWSPSGAALIAYVTRPSDDGRVRGRLWTVDADAAAPLWDTGDMEGLPGSPMSDWLADDTLVLARKDGMWVRPDGSRTDAGPVIEDQPRAVDVSPDGRMAFVEASGGSWLAAPEAGAFPIAGAPEGGIASWSWRADGNAIAAEATSGELYVVDVASFAATAVARPPGAAPGERSASPRWLADGRILIGEPRAIDAGGRRIEAHLIVDTDSGEVATAHAVLGIGPEAVTAESASDWVSADGRLVRYPDARAPRTTAPVPEAQAEWLYDVVAGEVTSHTLLVGALWAPEGDAVAWVADGRLSVWRPTQTEALALTDAGSTVVRHAWSPDARWLLFQDDRQALWITASDGTAAPFRVAARSGWDPPPTWAPSGDRFAAQIASGDDALRLALVDVGWMEGTPAAPPSRTASEATAAHSGGSGE